MPASAKDTIFDSRQYLVGRLKALLRRGRLQRRTTTQEGIRCPQPGQCLLPVGETSPACTHSVMNRPGGTVSNSRFDGVVATLLALLKHTPIRGSALWCVVSAPRSSGDSRAVKTSV